MDRDLLSRAYDRSAATYDERFRPLQREKYRAAAALLDASALPAGDVLDAGGGTALFSEWLADPSEPRAELRAALRLRRLVVLDTSVGMLRLARPRTPLCVAGDLALPPFRDGRFGLVLSFTSMLTEPARALGALAALLAPGGALLATFLADEAAAAEAAFSLRGLRRVAGGIEAGQDRAFLLRPR